MATCDATVSTSAPRSPATTATPTTGASCQVDAPPTATVGSSAALAVATAVTVVAPARCRDAMQKARTHVRTGVDAVAATVSVCGGLAGGVVRSLSDGRAVLGALGTGVHSLTAARPNGSAASRRRCSGFLGSMWTDPPGVLPSITPRVLPSPATAAYPPPRPTWPRPQPLPWLRDDRSPCCLSFFLRGAPLPSAPPSAPSPLQPSLASRRLCFRRRLSTAAAAAAAAVWVAWSAARRVASATRSSARGDGDGEIDGWRCGAPTG